MGGSGGNYPGRGRMGADGRLGKGTMDAGPAVRRTRTEDRRSDAGYGAGSTVRRTRTEDSRSDTGYSAGPAVRLMRLADVAQVGALERECFANPWSEGILTDGLGNHLDCFWVLEEAGALLGYLSMRVITDEGELNRIAISPAYRGRGLSKLLMDTMFEYCRGHEVRRIFLEVRSGNEAARGLYASCGFSQIAVRKGYYRKPVEDALILRWEEEPPTQDGA